MCSCGWEPRLCGCEKKNEMSLHVKEGNEHGGEERDPK